MQVVGQLVGVWVGHGEGIVSSDWPGAGSDDVDAAGARMAAQAIRKKRRFADSERKQLFHSLYEHFGWVIISDEHERVVGLFAGRRIGPATLVRDVRIEVFQPSY